MKSFLLWTMILWGGIVLEQARPGVFPSAVLSVPLVVGCIFWFRSGRGMLLSGTALLFSWMLMPTLFPLTTVVVTAFAAFFLTRSGGSAAWSGRPRGAWLAPGLTMFAGLVSHVAVIRLSESVSMWEHTLVRLPVGLSMGLAVVFVLRMADEFGIRQTSTI